jgi:general stress protein CsbA
MKEWFVSMLSNCSKVSSKRIVAIFVTINLIVFSYVATFTHYVCPITMFDTLALLTGGLFTGTVIERFTKQAKNGTTNDSSTTDSTGNV